MKVHYGFDDLGKITNPVVTTGSFDGVHVGHYAIIRRLKNQAREINGQSVLITFHPHPRKVLYPETAGKNLFLIKSQKEKILQLEKTGLDHLIIVPFSKEFSEISSEEFIKKFLVDKIGAKCVIVGFNHYFGHNREGNFQFLYELGKQYDFLVEEIPEQDIQDETVSSTNIRKAIQEGYIQKANAYLDHIYNIIGPLVLDDNPYHQFGIQTYQILIEEEEKLLPPDGFYAVKLKYNNSEFKGMVIRSEEIENATIQTRTIYLHLFDNPYGMAGKECEVLFFKRIKSTPGSSIESFQEAFKNAVQEILELIY